MSSVLDVMIIELMYVSDSYCYLIVSVVIKWWIDITHLTTDFVIVWYLIMQSMYGECIYS